MTRRRQRYPRAVELASTYAERRHLLMIELRLMRLTHPARRVVKHQQKLMRQLRWMHYSEHMI